MIISLLGCTDAAIKARALHLLGLSLSSLEGQVSSQVCPAMMNSTKKSEFLPEQSFAGSFLFVS